MSHVQLVEVFQSAPCDVVVLQLYKNNNLVFEVDDWLLLVELDLLVEPCLQTVIERVSY